MRRSLGTIAVVMLCVVRVAADLTVTSTTTIEGGMAAMGNEVAPRIVTRIKGNKSRTDIEVGDQTMSAIVDLATKQAILLRPDQKTAQIVEPAAAAASTASPMPAIETTVKPTGQSREINGMKCDEYAISMAMNMAAMAGGRSDMPPEASGMLKGVRMTMTGSSWVAKNAPGAAEFAAFQSAAAKTALAALSAGGSSPSGGSSGLPVGLERMITGFAEAPGIPYLTELTMGIEGSGQLVAIMKQMGETKIITRVTNVSAGPLDDTLFRVPDGYTIVKQ
jgi:Domain of unknown function (DUF4412)